VRVIGAADEFWRLRLTRVDTTDELSFEWHDDILYREPTLEEAREVEQWNIEAVYLADLEAVVLIGSFEKRAEAEAFYERAVENLSEMSKSEFEDMYFESDESTNDAVDSRA
jgi:hypothetical protein